jgi:hypothetical protein
LERRPGKLQLENNLFSNNTYFSDWLLDGTGNRTSSDVKALNRSASLQNTALTRQDKNLIKIARNWALFEFALRKANKS